MLTRADIADSELGCKAGPSVRDSRKLPQQIREAERAIRERLFSTSPIGPPEQRAFKVVRNSVIGFVYDVRTKTCFVSPYGSAQYRALEVAYDVSFCAG